jgi:hypothetical protein
MKRVTFLQTLSNHRETFVADGTYDLDDATAKSVIGKVARLARDGEKPKPSGEAPEPVAEKP